MHSGVGFTETDTPNFSGSFYSFTKTHTEQLLCSAYASNTLVLRLRMPVSDDLHPRSFVTKISKYDRVVDIPNSNTILHDILPCSITLGTEQRGWRLQLHKPRCHLSQRGPYLVRSATSSLASPGRTSVSKSRRRSSRQAGATASLMSSKLVE